MFDFEGFVEDCKRAVKGPDARDEIQELVERAVSSPKDLLAAIGEPTQAGVNRIHVSDELTILNLVWGPEMELYPHNHEMWAVIGLYGGQEDNTFWRRNEEQTLTKHGTKILTPGSVSALGKDVIHSVHNPLQQLTGARYMYTVAISSKRRAVNGILTLLRSKSTRYHARWRCSKTPISVGLKFKLEKRKSTRRAYELTARASPHVMRAA